MSRHHPLFRLPTIAVPGSGAAQEAPPDAANEATISEGGAPFAGVRIISKGVAAKEARTGTCMPSKAGSQITDDQVVAAAPNVWSLSRSKPESASGTGGDR